MTAGRRRNGFTLVEVMVALVIGGMAVASAGALLRALADRARAIARAAALADGNANAERELRSLAANLDVSADTRMPAFTGDAHNATFSAWCETPAGWLDHCHVRLSFVRRDSMTALGLELRGASSSTVDVRGGFRTGHLRYLTEVDGHPTWMESWSQRVAPTALAVIIDADTLLLPVGGGG